MVLDVGCGGGVLLHKVKEMMPHSITCGVEPNELYADLARRKSGAREIKTGYFSSELFKCRFDVVLSCDVLEHVESPDLFLKDIYSSLNKGGVLFFRSSIANKFQFIRAIA
jgi:2-polyprenyl-3-methyl-5-hydroxy-6-metoxy-1,4-benzoquinol methylase